jgi:hypothetical protein
VRGGELVRKLAIADRCFRRLINGDDDGLNVLIAPTFSGGEMADFLERLERGRRVRFVVEPSQRLAHHRRPLSGLPL